MHDPKTHLTSQGEHALIRPWFWTLAFDVGSYRPKVGVSIFGSVRFWAKINNQIEIFFFKFLNRTENWFEPTMFSSVFSLPNQFKPKLFQLSFFLGFFLLTIFFQKFYFRIISVFFSGFFHWPYVSRIPFSSCFYFYSSVLIF